MRLAVSVLFLLLTNSFIKGQSIATEWYSETVSNGVRIQNSYNRGGPYTGLTKSNFNHSYLVYFTRVTNETEQPLEIELYFSADSIAIPNSPDTFVKLFLSQDSIILDSQNLFRYGVTELATFDQPTSFHRKLKPNEDCLLYVVAIFYQTKDAEWAQERGGNRAEFFLKGKDLYYRMSPQIDSLYCGHVFYNN